MGAEMRRNRLNATYKNEKGFTLVELIVVLVILAVLAAILIPQLLGWIDRAKVNQDMFNARNCMTATQAELTKLYAFAREGQAAGSAEQSGEKQERSTVVKGVYGVNNNGDAEVQNTDFAKNVRATADEDPYILIVGLGRHEKYAATDLRKAFTVYVAMYMKDKDSKPLFYDGEQWTTQYLEKEPAKIGCVFEKSGNQMKSNGVYIQFYVVANKSGKRVTGNQIWKLLRDKSK